MMKLPLLLALSLIQISVSHAQSVSETHVDLPESPRERMFYVGGILGVPYSTTSAATSGGSPTGFSYGVNAGVQPIRNVNVGAFYNESLSLGNTAMSRAGKRFGIESEYLLPAFETWTLALGYRLGLVQIAGVTPFFPEGVDIQGLGHGPKLTMIKKLNEFFALGLELSYFVYNNPQATNVSVYGNKAGTSLSNPGVMDANLSFRFLL